MYSKSILTFSLAFLFSYFLPTPTSTDISILGLKIKQRGKEFSINTKELTVALVKDKFTLTFDLERDDDVAQRYYAARLIADVDPDIFNQFETGKSFEEIPALALGTSMAGPKDAPYECIFFDDQAHHYIFYNNEEERRANLISKENGLLQLSFDIENYCMHDLEVNIKNSNFEQIFLVFLIDKNLNETIDEGEYVELEVNFK